MDTQKAQIIDRLGQATNILVTVSANPSVDQLACAIGLTLLLNKMGKHATAVFSGDIPSTVQFLQPEKTLEKNTDSLRDFIIALDKSKADKLRYKVEDQMVKIFITPYRTSISEKDLEYTQGDFNVEVVIALGVKEQKDLDAAIIAHGRILHDATVIGIDTQEGLALGSINWVRTEASSLCEMGAELGVDLQPDILDDQIATAFLTGVVAGTERFSNEKTSSTTMHLSAKLMAAGADPQLVATQLQPLEHGMDVMDESLDGVEPLSGNKFNRKSKGKPRKEQASADGTIEIEHGASNDSGSESSENEDNNETVDQIQIDETGNLNIDNDNLPSEDQEAKVDIPNPVDEESHTEIKHVSRLLLDPPSISGKYTDNNEPESFDPSIDQPGSSLPQMPLLSHDTVPDNKPTPLAPGEPIADSSDSAPIETPLSLPGPIISPEDTLAELEKVVDSPHVKFNEADSGVPDQGKEETANSSEENTHNDVNFARDAVQQAMNGTPQQNLAPVQALNAQPMDLNLGDMPAVNTSLESAFTNFVPTDSPLTPSDPASVPDKGLPAMPVFSDPSLESPQPSSAPILEDLTSPPAQISVDPSLPITDTTTPAEQSSMMPPPVPPPMMPPMMPPTDLPTDDPENPVNKAL